jgi:hypothetical protein
VCCQVEVSALGQSLVQWSSTDCGVSECDREASIMRRPCPTRGCCATKKKKKKRKAWFFYTGFHEPHNYPIKFCRHFLYRDFFQIGLKMQNPGVGKQIFSCPHPSRPAPAPTWSPVLWVQGLYRSAVLPSSTYLFTGIEGFYFHLITNTHHRQ